MSAKANLVLLFIAGIMLAALAGRNGSLALMALPFLFYLAAGLLTSPKAIRLRASRSLSKIRCETNNPITHTVVIENDGPNVPYLKICEPISSKIRVLEGSLEQRVALPANEKVELRYTFAAPRGRYEWQSIALVASDPFGLFEHRCEIPAPAQVLVLPQPLPLRRLPVRLSHTLRTVGPNLSRLPGSGIDFWGVREYHPGDSLRSIHWRSTARHPQQFFTKEFEREEMANIGLLLDARAVADQTEGGENLLEYSIQATASLAKSLLQMGNRVSLLILGGRFVRVFPGIGKYQLVRILDQLAECEPGKKILFDALKHVPVRLFPANSMIVVVSPLRPDDFPSIARLRAAGYQVLLVSPNPVKYSAPTHPAGTSTSLAVRAAVLERAALIWRIRKIGVGVVDWPVDKSLAQQMWKIPRTKGGGQR